MTDTRWLSTEKAARLFGFPSADDALALFYFRSLHWDEKANVPTQEALNLGIAKRDDADQEWLWRDLFLEAVGVYWQVPRLRGVTNYTSPAHAIDLVRQGIAQVVEANPAWVGSSDERQRRMGEDTSHTAELLQEPEVFLTTCAYEGLEDAIDKTTRLYVYFRSQVDQKQPRIAAGLKLAESGITMANGIGAVHPFVRYELLSLGKPSRRKQPPEPLGSDRIDNQYLPLSEQDD